MTHLDTLSRRLRHATAGRENHADHFALTAELQPGRKWTRLYWTDSYTGQSGDLGSLYYFEIETAIPALFTQLRQWRALACRPTSTEQPKANRDEAAGHDEPAPLSEAKPRPGEPKTQAKGAAA